MNVRFYLTNLLIGLVISGYMIYSPPTLTVAGIYIFNSAAIVNAIFFPFARIFFRRKALAYSNGNEWKYPNAIVRGDVDFLSIILAFLAAIPVGIPYAVYMLATNKKGA
jgi:hypothetical protein